MFDGKAYKRNQNESFNSHAFQMASSRQTQTDNSINDVITTGERARKKKAILIERMSMSLWLANAC